MHGPLGIRKCIRQAKQLFIIHFCASVIKYHTLGSRKPYQLTSVYIFSRFFHKTLILCRNIEQKTQRNIGTDSTLVFIKVQGIRQQKCQIIIHGHIYHVFQRNHLQRFFILIITVIQGIIKLQQRFPVMFKNITEQSVLYFSVAEIMP